MRERIAGILRRLANKISKGSIEENFGPPFLITLQFETLNEAMDYVELFKDDTDWQETITRH